MFSVAVKHMSSSGQILASRVMGVEDGTIKPVRKHYGLAMSYRINEGNGSPATTVDTVFPSGKYDALNYTPVWAHHRFGGWYDSVATPTTAVPTGTSISPSDSVVYDRSDVYARWQLPATVSFDATSGGGQMPGGWTAPDYYIGQPYGVLPVPTKSGETFLGWFTSGGARITEDTTVPSDGTTLTARYMAVNYTTSYTCTTTSSYRNTGIYSATRYSSSSPVVVDWGDNSVDVVYGSISQLAHTYSTSATFTVKISDNISSLQMSYSNSTWYGTTSQNRYTLKTIASLDSKITNYPSYGFYYCSALTSVTVPSGMTTVNTYCFYYCSALQNVALPSSCTSIGNYAFQYSGLRTTAGFVLPSNLTSIGSGAFRNISNSYFTTLTIPGTVTTIGSYAFYYCYYLKNITFASGSGTLTLNSYAFAYCGYYSTMALDMSTRTVTTIPGQCFYYCRYLKDFVFPKGVTTIGTYAFYYCWNQSSAAGTLTVPEGVTSISSSYAFAYCYYLTEISLPSTLTSIGSYAFYYCQRLATIRSNRLTAPTVQSTTFGNSATYYTGRSSYSSGTNRLYVPTGATGYNASYWSSVLLDSTKCGFTKEEEVLDMTAGHHSLMRNNGEFVFLDYIDCDTQDRGASSIWGAYAKTDISNLTRNSWELESTCIRTSTLGEWNFLCGCEASDNESGYIKIRLFGGNASTWEHNTNYSDTSPCPLNEVQNVTIKNSVATVNSYSWSVTSSTVTNSHYFCIGGTELISATSYNARTWPGCIGRTKVSQNGVLLGDFIPAMRVKDAVYGFYDAVSENFYSSCTPVAFKKASI